MWGNVKSGQTETKKELQISHMLRRNHPSNMSQHTNNILENVTET